MPNELPAVTSTHSSPRHARKQQTLGSWVGDQLVAGLWVIVQPVVGPILAIARRRFHFRAALVALATMILGIGAVGALIAADPLGLGARARELLWPGVLIVMLAAGFVAGRVGRRVGGWESYVALLLTTAIFVVHLAWGWHRLLGAGASDALSAWELSSLRPLGEEWLGELWLRVVAIMALLGLVVAVFGGSLAYLFYGESGRFDASFSIEWFVSHRHLAREGRGSVSLTAAVAVVGIALGVGALVAVTAVMSGYQEDIRDKILSTNAHLIVQKYGRDFVEHREVAEKLGRVEGVVATAPFVFNEAMLSDGESGRGVHVKGIAPESARRVTSIEENLCLPAPDRRCRHLAAEARQGMLARWLEPQDGAPAIIVGSELLKQLGREVGSSVLLTTPVGLSQASGNAPRRTEFRIAGAFRSGMHEFDSRLVYLELGAAQELLGMGKAVDGVELRVSDPEAVDLVQRSAMRAVGRYPYSSLDWRRINSGIFMALTLQKVVMFLILTFIVIVAAFNIASTLFMAAVERAHEIAVLKSMGARDASIMKIFVLQGWIVGGVGTVLGVALGLALCAILAEVDIGIAADVYMVESLEVRVWPLEILLTILATFVISHLATLYPALKAARQRPVDAMRYE